MRALFFCATASVCLMVCAAQTTAPAGKMTGAKATVSPSVTRKPAASTGKTTSLTKTVTHTTSRSTAATAHRSAGRRTVPVRTAAAKPRQLQPTSDRYQEIQNALVAKGYLQPDQATGTWDQNSVEGLKRFQADQKLDSTGKLTSMSLIALGLGPRHDADAAVVAGPEN